MKRISRDQLKIRDINAIQDRVVRVRDEEYLFSFRPVGYASQISMGPGSPTFGSKLIAATVVNEDGTPYFESPADVEAIGDADLILALYLEAAKVCSFCEPERVEDALGKSGVTSNSDES